MAEVARLYDWTAAISESKLPQGPKHVALAISLYLSRKQSVAWPKQKSLALDCSMGERTVRQHLATLEAEGWLVREKRNAQGKSDLITPVIPPAKSAGGDAANLAGGPLARSAGEEVSSLEVLGRVSQETLPAKAPRKRDPLWDVFDEELYPAVTKNERGRRNAALKQIREALPISPIDLDDPDRSIEEIHAGELRARIARYRVRFPGVACTETAIASHWSSLAGPNGRPSQPPCPECEMGHGFHAADCPRVRHVDTAPETIPSANLFP